MARSLRSTITPQSLVDTFDLQWKTPKNAGKVLVLVEGQEDYCLFFKFFDNQHAVVKDCGGCKKILEVFNLLQDKQIVNIGIKDSDFDRLNQRCPQFDNLFYTDAHDHEMMCWKNNKTVKTVCANIPIEYDENIFLVLIDELKFLSYFKWINYTNHLNYNFKSFSVEGKAKQEINDFEYINNSVLSKSPSVHAITKRQLEDFIVLKQEVDLYELVNGHDYSKRLIYYLKQNFEGFTNLKEENLKIILHTCFGIPEFQQTVLYRNISIWEQNKKVQILQRSDN